MNHAAPIRWFPMWIGVMMGTLLSDAKYSPVVNAALWTVALLLAYGLLEHTPVGKFFGVREP